MSRPRPPRSSPARVEEFVEIIEHLIEAIDQEVHLELNPTEVLPALGPPDPPDTLTPDTPDTLPPAPLITGAVPRVPMQEAPTELLARRTAVRDAARALEAALSQPAAPPRSRTVPVDPPRPPLAELRRLVHALSIRPGKGSRSDPVTPGARQGPRRPAALARPRAPPRSPWSTPTAAAPPREEAGLELSLESTDPTEELSGHPPVVSPKI